MKLIDLPDDVSYPDLAYSCSATRAIIDAGGSAEDVAVALYAQVQQLTRLNVELSMIAPFRVRLGNGTEWIWRCPDHLVPLRTSIPNPGDPAK
jgi:hypothetical protein